MWYRITYSVRSREEQKFTELIFSYEDKLRAALAGELGVQPSNLVIHEIEKYSMKEGTC